MIKLREEYRLIRTIIANDDETVFRIYQRNNYYKLEVVKRSVSCVITSSLEDCYYMILKEMEGVEICEH